MALNSCISINMRQIDQKQMPTALYQMVEVKFTSANSDVVVPHTLDPHLPHEVRYIVVDTNSAGGVIYRGVKAPGNNFIVLRASATGAYRIRLFLESHAGVTNPLSGSLGS